MTGTSVGQVASSCSCCARLHLPPGMHALWGRLGCALSEGKWCAKLLIHRRVDLENHRFKRLYLQSIISMGKRGHNALWSPPMLCGATSKKWLWWNKYESSSALDLTSQKCHQYVTLTPSIKGNAFSYSNVASNVMSCNWGGERMMTTIMMWTKVWLNGEPSCCCKERSKEGRGNKVNTD